MLTTRRRLASARRCFASRSPISIFFASSISSSAERRGTLPISFKYILTGSSMLMPSGTVRSMSSTSTSSSSVRMISSSSTSSSSVMRSTSTLFCSSVSKILSNCSSSRVRSEKKSLISWYSRTFFFFFATARRSFRRSSNFACTFSSMNCSILPMFNLT